MKHFCNIKELNIGLFYGEGNLNWTINANGQLTLGGIQGRILVLLLNYLNVTPRFFHAPSYQQYGYFGLDMLVGRDEVLPYNYLNKMSPFEMNYMTFAVRKSVPMSTRYAFLHPFTLNTWLSFLFVLILTSVLGIVLMKKKLSYLDLLIQMFGSFLKQCFQISAKSLKVRLFLIFWLFFTIVISFSYSAVFFSFMVNPLKNPPVRNFEELSAAVTKGTHKCYFYSSIFVAYAINMSTQDYMKPLAKISEEKSYQLLDKDSSIYENLINQGNAIISDNFALVLKFGMNSEVFISDDKISPSLMTPYTYSNNFCLKKKIDVFMSRVWGAGLYQKMFKDEQLKPNRPTGQGIKPLSLHDISGVLNIFIFGLIISFFVFIMEIIVYHYQKICLVVKSLYSKKSFYS